MSAVTSLRKRFDKLAKKVRFIDFAQTGKWTFYFILIGVIAGMGSILFYYLCELGVHYFLDLMAGYRPPSPAGEQRLLPPTQTPFNRWVLLFLPALGGLVSGLLVYTFAPEAEGPGTDAAIDAYHNKDGFIRGRVPFIKTIASAITLTTGGSGGREGPIVQIGAGFGSFLATRLKLSVRERRIMLAAGISAAVGSIFRTPLAGALFAAEVLYRDPDLEPEVIIPAGITSVVAYCLFCLVFGWGSLFDTPYFHMHSPLTLGPYLVLALVLVGTGVFYIKSFYKAIHLFKSLKLPQYLKPAIGGLCTGIIGFFLPQTLSFGYGFIQMALQNEMTIPFLLLLAVGKVLTTSFSIGSGGSGGVFGPALVIGGSMGGVVGNIFNGLMPEVVSEPGAFVVVGMAGFFTVISNTPISTIIFVSEMTGSYHLLLPSLLVCSVAFLSSRKWTICEKQVKNRLDSPAHTGDFFIDILQSIRVMDLMPLVKKVELIPRTMTLLEFKKHFSETTHNNFPVMDENGKLVGIFSSTDIRGILFSHEIERLVIMQDIANKGIIYTTPSEDLNSVLQKFTTRNLDSLPVVKDNDATHLIGMLNRREVITFYNWRIDEMKKQVGR